MLKNPPFLAPLEGTYQGNKWRFTEGGVEIPDLRESVFMIIMRNKTTLKTRLVGTGFYIHCNGLFLTAKHVLEDAFATQLSSKMGAEQRDDVLIVHTFRNNSVAFRPVCRFWHSVCDIGIGVAAEMKNEKTGNTLVAKPLSISFHDGTPEEKLITYGFSNTQISEVDGTTIVNSYPDFYEGTLIENLPNGRDASSMPWPCVHMNINIHGGSSGGPVISSMLGSVIAVNSTSFEPFTDISYATMIRTIADGYVTDVNMPGESAPRTVTIKELIAKRMIIVK